MKSTCSVLLETVFFPDIQISKLPYRKYWIKFEREICIGGSKVSHHKDPTDGKRMFYCTCEMPEKM